MHSAGNLIKTTLDDHTVSIIRLNLISPTLSTPSSGRNQTQEFHHFKKFYPQCHHQKSPQLDREKTAKRALHTHQRVSGDWGVGRRRRRRSCCCVPAHWSNCCCTCTGRDPLSYYQCDILDLSSCVSVNGPMMICRGWSLKRAARCCEIWCHQA